MKTVTQMMFELNAWATAGQLDQDDTLRCQEVGHGFNNSRGHLSLTRRANYHVRGFYAAVVKHYGFNDNAVYNPDRK